jgi:preprotein translocase subunit SecF
MKALGFFILAFVAILLIGLGLGWFSAGTDVVSAKNVKAQWAEAYKANEALTASVANVCSAKALVAASTSDAERIQRQSQQAAYEMNYARIASDYDAQVRDAFRAKFVKPGDLPARSPTLASQVEMTCP